MKRIVGTPKFKPVGVPRGSVGASAVPFIALSNATQAENTSANTAIGTLAVRNAPAGSWSFSETADPDNVFTITVATLKNSAVFNYEVKTTHTITITATDANLIYDDIVHTFTINVTDVPKPVFTVAPAITGTEEVGSTLTVSNGTALYSPTSHTYQWFRALTMSGAILLDASGLMMGEAIVGETGNTYELDALDEDEFVFCEVTAISVEGSTMAQSNATGAIASAGVVYATLDPINTSPNLDLSNGNLTITPNTNTTHGDVSRGATGGSTTGKYFCEYTVTQSGLFGTGVGICNDLADLSDNDLSVENGALYQADGNVYFNGGSSAIATFATGNVIGQAIDIGAGLGWWRVGAGNWNNNPSANPATGVGGIDLSGIAAPWYPMAYAFQGHSGVTTVNFGATSYAHAAPSGFSNWVASSASEWITVWSPPLAVNSTSSGWGGYTMVDTFPVGTFNAATGSAARFTVTFADFSSSETLKGYFGKKAASGDEYDFLAADARNITFGSADHLNSDDVTMQFVSDGIALGSAYDKANAYNFSAEFSGSGFADINSYDVGAGAALNNYYHLGADAATEDKSSYVSAPGKSHLLSKVEVFGTPVPSTWTQETPAAVLSNGNTTITSTGPAAGKWATARTTQKAFGKRYFRMTIGSPGGTEYLSVGFGGGVGVETINDGGGSWAGNLGQGIGYFDNGKIYNDGVLVDTIASFTNGDVIWCAYDQATGKVWFSKNAMPDVSTGGYTLSFNLFAMYGLVAIYDHGTGSATLNTSSAGGAIEAAGFKPF